MFLDALNLTAAQISVPANASARVHAAADDLLIVEAAQRGVTWSVGCTESTCIRLSVLTAGASECGALGSGPESFEICITGRDVVVAGRSELALMMAAGRLLREIRWDGDASLPADSAIAADPPPWARMRGHQLTDWGFYMTDFAFEQFVRELIVFGTNQVEFAHIDYAPDPLDPHRDDAAALVRRAAIVDKYGLAVSLWNVPWPSSVSASVFERMARVDAIFFEGGEGSGGLDNLQTATRALRAHHPSATAWHSPGGRNATEMSRWFEQLALPETRAWLDGAVYGPTTLGGEAAMAARLPAGYALRLYPDICHTLTAMLPVPNWHFAWAFTAGRQAVNPLPRHYAAAISTFQGRSRQRAVGFGAYSEGAADDLNKALWSAAFLEPELPPERLVRQYAGYFAGAADAELVGALIFGLEENWRGDAASNRQVLATLATAQQLEQSALAAGRGGWRLLSHVFRAYFDAAVQARLA